MRTEVKLSKRLERIASFVQPGSRVADIGTGSRLCADLAGAEGRVPVGIGDGCGKRPLERAEEHVEEVGLSGKIELRLSDGLAKLKAGEADTVVIAGMGGKLTCRILEQGRHVWENWSEGKERLISVAAVGAGRSASFSGKQDFRFSGSDADGRGKYYYSDRSGGRHDANGESRITVLEPI